MWCILNRYDSGSYPRSLEAIVAQKDQFAGYDPETEVTPEIRSLVEDVLNCWAREQAGETQVGRTMSREYRFFRGDGRHNHFTVGCHTGRERDWFLPSPCSS